MQTYKQVLLVIFDGWGMRDEDKYNAIKAANPTFFNSLWQKYPHTLLEASGEAVGLPKGQIGTSEISHTIIGAGSVMYTDLVRINKEIENGAFNQNETFHKLFAHVKENNSTLHVMGMMSPGGVHSHQDHFFAFLKLAKEQGITKIAIHAFTDGRDLPPKSGHTYMKQLETLLTEIGVGKIVTVSGRYYAMDRDNHYERLQPVLDSMFEHKGTEILNKKASEIIENYHHQDLGDEFIPSTMLTDASDKDAIIKENDGVFFFNFRPDRARMISKKISEKVGPMHLFFATMTLYDPTLTCLVAYPPETIKTTLAEQLSTHKLTQVHVAETEKYAHVTYFFNGGNETPHANERFELIDSRKDVATHDQAPEMKAKEIVDKALEYVHNNTNFIVINFANPDMVGHTGKYDAAVKAIQAVDPQLERLVTGVMQNGGVAFITSDHGNAELMFNDETGQPQTAHTTFPVPGILTSEEYQLKKGGLADIAPTILELFGIEKPAEMSGHSLLEKNA